MCESLGCVAQMSQVTDLMNAAKAGDRVAAAELLPLVYAELRKLAAVRMVREDCNHTLQPTALVHEAYLRLIGPTDEIRWQNEGHFFAAAAEAMRRILVDAARRKAALRHGGERVRVELLPMRINLTFSRAFRGFGRYRGISVAWPTGTGRPVG